MVPWWIGLPAIMALTPVGPLAIGTSTPRRVAAVAVSLLTLAVPFFVVGPPLAVTLSALFAVLGPFKTVQLAADPVHRTAAFRVWQGVMPFDAREARPAPAGLDRRAASSVAVHGLLTIVGVAGVLLAGTGASGVALRLASGVVAVYGGTSGLADVYVFVHRLAGIEVPRFMRTPILSKTIAEFWSLRWNRAVHGMLRGALYRPLARRGFARLGVLATFAGSAALHFWIVGFTVSGWLALQMASFFLVQGVLALVENRLRVRRWRPSAARAWTIGTFALSSPLFVEPFLRGLGI